MSGLPRHTTTVLRGNANETGPLYTRLLATDRDGPHGGALYLTAEVYREVGVTGAVFPIWRSLDGGRTWEHTSDVADSAFGVGNRFQPDLYELPVPFAGLAAGTLLLAGNAFPRDASSTRLVIYASEDGAATWSYCGQVDLGGPAEYDPSPDARTSAVWEPNLELIGDELVCYYADERRKEDGMLQVLAHRTSRNLVDWSEQVLDFGVPDRATRPGMFVGTGRMPDGKYRAVLEVVGVPDVPIYLAESADGLDWGPPEQLGTRLVSEDGIALSGTPNVHWRHGPDGATVIVTGRHSIDVHGRAGNHALVNSAGGIGSWLAFPLPTPAERHLTNDASGYSQSLLWNLDQQLVHATTVQNDRGSHDIVVTVADDRALDPSSGDLAAVTDRGLTRGRWV